MSTLTLPVGARVADAAYPPPAKSLVDGGYVALCGYVSTPTSNPKNWTRARIEECAGVGLGVVMFAEQSEGTPFTGYSAANKQLGAQATAMCASFGYPVELPVWFAVDEESRSRFTSVEGAFTAYRETCPHPLGCYGGSQLIDHLMEMGLCEYGHMAAATSWSSVPGGYYVSPRAHMRQYPSIPFGGSRIDPNAVLLPTPVWMPGDGPGPQPPQPVQGAEDVLTVINLRDADAVFSGNMNAQGTIESVRWVNGALRDVQVAQGAQQISRSFTELGHMTLVGPLPTGDSRHQWTGAEFFSTALPGEAGPPGPPGPPGGEGPAGAAGSVEGTYPASITIHPTDAA